MNTIGFWTLFIKEIKRTKDVAIQAFLSPVITTLLYFLVFGSAIGNQVQALPGVSYGAFIVPGLITMSLLMNALMASSSGIYFQRFLGTITDLLTAPMSFLEIALAYALSATVRSVMIGVTIYAVAALIAPIPVHHVFFVLVFGFLMSFAFSLLGLVLGIWAKDFEQLSIFPSLVITPLSFLGGIFYSVHMLPAAWQSVTYVNPIFYMVDGLRWGFIGVSDVNPLISLGILSGIIVLSSFVLQWMFKTGYRLRS